MNNWQRSGFKNKEDAMLSAIGAVLEHVPNTSLILGKKVFTNQKQSHEKTAKYCKKHGQVAIGNVYLCGCKL